MFGSIGNGIALEANSGWTRMLRQIKTETTGKYNQLCIEALQSARFSIFSKPAYLHFMQAGDRTVRGPCGELVYDYESGTLDTVIKGLALPKKGRVHELRLDASTLALQQLSVREIPKLFAQGYTINDGEVILYRCLSKASVNAGAGYDYIPDEDEYEETKLHFKRCKLELEPREMPAEVKEEISQWFSGLETKYGIRQNLKAEDA
ncbi:hypothetical protein HY642_04055 [Candidatus Woesearchaeota archaeon]|nr:hypothetical protein [Candidatus Woesearchaeota archaeon]